jgi:hypothetical protein
MAGPLSFDAYLGWVNITDPNNIPQDARVISADDLLRYEKLGLDVKAKFGEVDSAIAALDSDAVMSDLIAAPSSEVRYAVKGMVDDGVADFQEVIDAVPGSVQAQVPPLVATAIAADSTITAAATTAVNTKVAGMSLVQSDDTRLPKVGPEEGVAFSIRDASNRASDIELGTDGHFTPRALGKIRDGLTVLPTGALVSADDDRVPEVRTTANSAFAILDAAGRFSDIELGWDGHFTQRVIDLLSKRIVPVTAEVIAYMAEITGTTPNRKLYRNEVKTGKRTLVQGTNDPRNAFVTPDGVIVYEDNTGPRYQRPDGTTGPMNANSAHYAFWGDSMTYSQLIYPARVGTNLGVTAYNGGIGSQTSTEVAIRAGAIIPAVTLTGNAIPAGTTATAATVTPTGDYGATTAAGKWSYPGTLNGIAGTLDFDRPSKTWSFTRTAAGSVVNVAAGTPFVVTGPTYADSVSFFWGGRNNLYSPMGTKSWRLENVLRDARAFVTTRTPYTKRIVIMGQINGTNEGRAANGSIYQDTVRINAELKADPITGPYYYDMRRAFIDNGMTRAGLTPTQADLNAIADDAPPPTLMNVALDHPGDTYGYPVIGDLASDLAISKGWTL